MKTLKRQLAVRLNPTKEQEQLLKTAIVEARRGMNNSIQKLWSNMQEDAWFVPSKTEESGLGAAFNDDLFGSGTTLTGTVKDTAKKRAREIMKSRLNLYKKVDKKKLMGRVMRKIRRLWFTDWDGTGTGFTDFVREFSGVEIDDKKLWPLKKNHEKKKVGWTGLIEEGMLGNKRKTPEQSPSMQTEYLFSFLPEYTVLPEFKEYRESIERRLEEHPEIKQKLLKKNRMVRAVINLPDVKNEPLLFRDKHWNIDENTIYLPFTIDDNIKHIAIKTKGSLDRYQRQRLGIASGNKTIRDVRIHQDNKGKWWARISYDITVNSSIIPHDGRIIAIDLGWRIPAVVYDGKMVRHFGDGDKIEKQFNHLKRIASDMQKNRAYDASKRMNQKLRDFIDTEYQKITSDIIEFSIGASIIAVGDLKNLIIGKFSHGWNEKIGNWARRRFIELLRSKAEEIDIEIIEISEVYTSQTCPRCGERNKPIKRAYKCKSCGYKDNRDRVGAINIYKRARIETFIRFHTE